MVTVMIMIWHTAAACRCSPSSGLLHSSGWWHRERKWRHNKNGSKASRRKAPQLRQGFQRFELAASLDLSSSATASMNSSVFR
uniref:Uncharacterized protein n=1 Tax=Zea mays TaxID=4577 RepID=C4J7A5_MAIZE|nr:unknown [Zea mays]